MLALRNFINLELLNVFIFFYWSFGSYGHFFFREKLRLVEGLSLKIRVDIHPRELATSANVWPQNTLVPTTGHTRPLNVFNMFYDSMSLNKIRPPCTDFNVHKCNWIFTLEIFVLKMLNNEEKHFIL